MTSLSLKEYREIYPEFDDLTDYEFGQLVHSQRGEGMGYGEFAQAIGAPVQESKVELAVRDWNRKHPDERLSMAEWEERQNPGFWGKVGNSGMAIVEGIGMMPGGVVDTLRDTWAGGDIDVTDREAIEDRRKAEAEKQAYREKYEGRTFEGIVDAMLSIPYSAATMGASLAGGALGGPAGAAAGMAASGAMAYRATKQDFLQRLLEKAEAGLGREVTPDEWEAIQDEFELEATKYGAWEAIPEAIGNNIFLRILGPVFKGPGKAGLKKTIGRMIGGQVEEQTTETATQYGQGGVEAEMGWRDRAPTIDEAFMEQAPATFWQTALMGAAHKTASLAANAYGERRERKADAGFADTEFGRRLEGLGIDVRSGRQVAEGLRGLGYSDEQIGSIVEQQLSDGLMGNEIGEANLELLRSENAADRIRGVYDGLLEANVNREMLRQEQHVPWAFAQAEQAHNQATWFVKSEMGRRLADAGMSEADIYGFAFSRGLEGRDLGEIIEAAQGLPGPAGAQEAAPSGPEDLTGEIERLRRDHAMTDDEIADALGLDPDAVRATRRPNLAERVAAGEGNIDLLAQKRDALADIEPGTLEYYRGLGFGDDEIAEFMTPEAQAQIRAREQAQKAGMLAGLDPEAIEYYRQQGFEDSQIAEFLAPEGQADVQGAGQNLPQPVQTGRLTAVPLQGLQFFNLMGGRQAGSQTAGAVPQAEVMPTASELTSIQQAPRADTQAAANSLGLTPPVVTPAQSQAQAALPQAQVGMLQVGQGQFAGVAGAMGQNRQAAPQFGPIPMPQGVIPSGAPIEAGAVRQNPESVQGQQEMAAGPEGQIQEQVQEEQAPHSVSQVNQPGDQAGRRSYGTVEYGGAQVEVFTQDGRVHVGPNSELPDEALKQTILARQAEGESVEPLARLVEQAARDLMSASRQNNNAAPEESQDATRKPLEQMTRVELADLAKSLGAGPMIRQKSKQAIIDWIREKQGVQEQAGQEESGNAESAEEVQTGRKSFGVGSTKYGQQEVYTENGLVHVGDLLSVKPREALSFAKNFEKNGGKDYDANRQLVELIRAAAKSLIKQPQRKPKQERPLKDWTREELLEELTENDRRIYKNLKKESLIRVVEDWLKTREARQEDAASEGSGNPDYSNNPQEEVSEAVYNYMVGQRYGEHVNRFRMFDLIDVADTYAASKGLKLSDEERVGAAASGAHRFIHDEIAKARNSEQARSAASMIPDGFDGRSAESLQKFAWARADELERENRQSAVQGAGQDAKEWLRQHVIVGASPFYPPENKENGAQTEDLEERYRMELPQVATVESGAIHKSDGATAIQAAMNWVRDNITSPVNTKGGIVEVTPRSVKDSLFHSMYQDKLDAVQALKPVLEHGAYLGEMPDKDGKRLTNHYYAARVGFANGTDVREKIVFVRTRQADGQENKFYVHEVFTEDDIKNSVARETTSRDTDQARFQGPHEFYKNLIASYLEVNENAQEDSASGQDDRAPDFADAVNADRINNMTAAELQLVSDILNGKGPGEQEEQKQGSQPQAGNVKSPKQEGGNAIPEKPAVESVVGGESDLDAGLRAGDGLRPVADGSAENPGQAGELGSLRNRAQGSDERAGGGPEAGNPATDNLSDAGAAGKRAAGGNKGADLRLGDESGKGDDNRNGQSRQRAEAEAEGEEGGESGDSARGESGRLTEVSDGQEVGKNLRNHRIESGDVLVPGGQMARAKANIAAIRIVKELEASGREATPDEKKKLAQFTGWGSLAQLVFNPNYERMINTRKTMGEDWRRFYLEEDISKFEKWERDFGRALHPDLGGMLTRDEWNAAAKSTLNAHYTDRKVVEAMWKMAERLGFSGGKVLEPSAGSGLFFGLMPENLARNSDLTGVELDAMTGLILKHLYPDADIQITGFENAKRVGDNTQDLVISNVPFGDYKVFDKKRPQYANQSIHNYFFSRAIDAVKPGGLCILISTHHTLDSGNAKMREEWGRKADLVGAVRLPGTAFEKNAGTAVTTDIVIFRKKTNSDFRQGESFRNLSEVETPEGPARINEYFAANPEMALGQHSLAGSMYGGRDEYTLKPDPGLDMEKALAEATGRLPANVYGTEKVASRREPVASGIAEAGMREGSLVLTGSGQPGIVRDGLVVEPEWAGNEKQREEAIAYIELKDTVKKLMEAMNHDSGDERVDSLRKELNRQYDAYFRKYGALNRPKAAFLQDDIEFFTVAAIEKVEERYDIRIATSGKYKGQQRPFKVIETSKGDIFKKRTVFPFQEPETADNIEDAIKISRIYRGGIDLPYIGRLLGMSEEQARQGLLAGDEVFENPENGLLEPRDIYLSGNVREKLARAEAALEDNPAYERNVEALRKVQPERVKIVDVMAKLGSTWLPASIYKGFLHHLGASYADIETTRDVGSEGTTRFRITNAWGFSAEATQKWATKDADIVELVNACLNLRQITIYDKNPDGTSYQNVEKTAAAREKQRQLQEEFAKWLPQSEYASEAEDIYNEKVNHSVLRKFEAPEIKYFPGASHEVELRPNQKQGVARALQESCLLAHGVGSGKTMLQATLAMEARRLGTARKPLIVVQGSTLSQFVVSFKRLYPGANILAPTEKQRDRKNRERILAQMATGDWDAIIVPHSFFDTLGVRPETERRFVDEQIAELDRQIEEGAWDDRRTRKQYEKAKEKLLTRIEKKLNGKRDEIYWDDLGVDMLIVDEAHAYKRGFFTTKMGNVKGLDTSNSQRSMQLLMKTRLIHEKTGGKNVILATGTPISNTITEMWTMLRYVRPDLLKEYNVEQFDDFASMFTTTTQQFEQTQSGEYKTVERFNKYINGPELLKLWRTASDVVLTEDLDFIKDMPKLKGGQVTSVVCGLTDGMDRFIKAVQELRRGWDNSGTGKKERPAMALEINTLLRKASVDPRLIPRQNMEELGLEAFEDDPGSKLNTAVRNIYERYRRDQSFLGTQLVFADLFKNEESGFNAFEDMRNKLAALGVPKEEMAIIHEHDSDKKREELFNRVKAGEVRILFGTTEKLGVGVNVQDRMSALHHLDAPPRPMDFEQRNGRIRRPGNQNKEVEIIAYGVERTPDASAFQRLAAKQRFINQLLRGELAGRSFENPLDEQQITFEDLEAAYSGDPRIREKNELTAALANLEMLERGHQSEMARKRDEIRSLSNRLERKEAQLPEARALTEFIEARFPEGEIADRKQIAQEAGAWIAQAEKDMLAALSAAYSDIGLWTGSEAGKYSKSSEIGIGHGVKVRIMLKPGNAFNEDTGRYEWKITGEYELSGPHGLKQGAQFSGANGLLTRIGNYLKQAGQALANAQNEIRRTREEIAAREKALKEPFGKADELERTRERISEIEAELAAESAVAEGGEALASIRPGQYLAARNGNARGLTREQCARVAANLNARAANAAPVEVVGSFRELPVHIRRQFADSVTELEGVYDPESGKVWLVAENLESTARAAEVWTHEQIVHNGLRGLFDESERKVMLNQLWLALGGMGNELIRQTAELYGIDPRSDHKGRLLVMEETLAALAERRQAGLLAPAQENMWRKVVAAVLNAVRKVIARVTGRQTRLGMQEVDNLLTALGQYVMDGMPEGGASPAFFRAENALPALRTKPAPKKTQTAYKLFRVDPKRPGQLFPLFVGANESVGMGVWHDAEIGEATKDGKVKSKLGGLAMRPGWHAGDVPVATHIGGKTNPADKAPGYRPDNQVWAEVEVAADVDWQAEADRRAERTKAGKIIPRTAHITDQIPEDGMYHYKTNSNMTGSWIITGAMKVNRILSDEEVQAINEAHGVADLPRQNPFEPEKYGFEKPLGSRKNGQTNSYGVPVERVTVIDRDISYEQVRDALKAMRGEKLYNVLENIYAQVNSNQEREILQGKNMRKSAENGFSTKEHLLGAAKIANIWKWSANTNVGGRKSSDSPDAAVKRFVAALNVNGRNAFAWLTIKETQRPGKEPDRTIYNIELLNEDKLRVYLGRESNSPNPHRSFEEIIARLSGPVKSESDSAPLASLKPRKLFNLGMKETVELADAPEIHHFFHEKDLSLTRRILALPHWVAKQQPAFARIYERQLKRMDECKGAVARSLEQVPALFGRDRLNKTDLASLNRLVWEIEGKPLPFEEKGTVKKYQADGKLDNGRTKIAPNPEYYDAYADALAELPYSKPVREAMLQIRKSLDEDLATAYNRMAAMSEASDDTITKLRDNIGHIYNYFPHHRYGEYFLQAKKDGKVVFRQHFDAISDKAARLKARELQAAQLKNYPDAHWSDGINSKLPDEVLGAPIDPEAMEQIIKAATAKLGDSEHADKIRDLVCKGVADVLKGRGWAEHAIGRKGVPGHEQEDITRVLYDYKAGLNGWLTKMDAARDFSRALGEIDARQNPQLWQYASQYVKDMLRNSDRIDRITNNIKAVAFAWYLGANIKTVAVNATQNIIVGVPRLEMDVTGGAPMWLKSSADCIVNMVTGNKGRGVTAAEQEMLRQLCDEKVITAAFMDEVRGHMQGLGIWAGLLRPFLANAQVEWQRLTCKKFCKLTRLSVNQLVRDSSP